MTDQTIHSIRPVKTLAERAADLEARERALAEQIARQNDELRETVLQRCAIEYEQRRGIASTLRRKGPAPDWSQLLKLDEKERKSTRNARTKALAELHLRRGWVAWGAHPQIVIAFELSKSDVGEMFWVRDGLTEILPHLKPAIPGFRIVGISHDGPYSLQYFLLCSVKGDRFQIVRAPEGPVEEVVLETSTLQGALEYVQKNLAR
jgi:hypothetical protein